MDHLLRRGGLVPPLKKHSVGKSKEFRKEVPYNSEAAYHALKVASNVNQSFLLFLLSASALDLPKDK